MHCKPCFMPLKSCLGSVATSRAHGLHKCLAQSRASSVLVVSCWFSKITPTSLNYLSTGPRAGYELRTLCSVHLSVYAAPLGGV